MGIMGTLALWVVNADNEFIVHDTASWTITVYSQDYSYWITIQEKNLWATDVWDYGYYYQWWNNNWNPWNSAISTDLLVWNSGYDNKWYNWTNNWFIKLWNWSSYTNTNYDIWADNELHDNVWWGGNDNEEQENIVKWYDTVNHVATNVAWRQWPCPEWYHVPSAWEWQELMMLWCNANPDICSWSVIKTQNGEYAWANSLQEEDWIIWLAFFTDLQLPRAGSRYYRDGAVDQGNNGSYWSSSPRGGSDPELAWLLYFDWDGVDPSISSRRAYGQSLRCFKNSYVELPKTLNLFFMSDGEEVWTWEVTENMTGAVPEKAKNVTKTGYILEYRYLSGADASTGFDFEITPISWAWGDESDNVYFIAQWTGIKYSVEFTWTDVEWTMPNQEFTYGIAQNLTANAFTKTWYTFSGWTYWTTWYTDGQEVINLTTTNETTVILTAEWTINEYAIRFVDWSWTETEVIYTWAYESIVTTDYPEWTKEWYTIHWDKGIPATMPLSWETITANWTPNEYAIVFVDWSWTQTAVIYSWDYESAVNTQYPSWTKDGYTIQWDKIIPDTMPLNGDTITASWTANTGTQYKIEYYFENVDGTDYVLSGILTENLSGTTDTLAEKTDVMEFSGFTFSGDKSTTSGKIAWNGSLVLKLYYDRNSYDYSIEVDGNVIQSWNVKFGATISKPSNPSKNGYKFIGWDPEIPATMLAEDVEVKATWEKLWSSGWWGGSSKSSSDVISNNSEKSTEQKDGDTWMDSSVEPQNDNQNAQDSQQADQASDKASEWQNQKQFTEEFQEAYNFAHSKWITTMPTIQSAQMDGKLTRIAMAKMLSYYAINVLWQKPDETRINKFNDISEKLDAQYDNGVTLAYQLWIMWINMPDNKFRPDDEVTRWEFGTALSRMIYKVVDWKDKYYSTHLAKLMEEWIITNDNPKMKELRGYVMIMLMRSAK